MSGKAAPDDRPAPGADAASQGTVTRATGRASRATGRASRDTASRDTVLMRALAHPARLALLDRLNHEGPATATECSQSVGLSPSAVSYHLRALARAGLVEEAPGRGDGRERRWRRTAERWSVGGVAGQGPEAAASMRTLLESLLALDDSRARQYLARFSDEPGEWQDAAFFMDAALLVTAEELDGLTAALLELTAPYREAARPDRPAGARVVSFTVRAFPA
jgi:DNA-binding transcriptional ArsR family regulator